MSNDDFDWDYMAPKDRVEVLGEGQYNFRIHQVVPKTSSKGNKMLELMLKVKDNDGRDWHIYEYLIWTSNDDAGKKRFNTKLGNIAKCIGKPEIDTPAYNKKQLSQDLLGAAGQCYIKVQEDKSGSYPDKSVVSKWISQEEAKTAEFIEDDIPF